MESILSRREARRRAIAGLVMAAAWREYRTSQSGDLSAALRWAWAREKRMAQTIGKVLEAADANGGVAAFSYDLTRSPIRRSLGSDPCAGFKAREASYYTSWLGR